MSLDEHSPLATVKNHLSEVVDKVEREHGRVVITKHGRPAAVLMSVADLESLEESLEILSDRAALRDLREAAAEDERGDTVALTRDEAIALITRQ
jgi:antitoxin YefM